jgi:hypothetical protein
MWLLLVKKKGMDTKDNFIKILKFTTNPNLKY